MSQTAIPLEFERYLQNQISVGDAPDMNEMIFAHIPGLDPSQPINRENGLPDVSLWVHQQDIDQVGKLGDNALAYSVVIPGAIAEFTFNAIYLRDKNMPNSCGMVVHKAKETKENGMASTKSLVQAYDGAAQIAGITVDASTWQIDYQARLKGIEEDHRLACLDNYGHTAFVDGFGVTQQADPNKYKVTPGVVYVGGLRGVLTGEVLQTITTKPNGLYVDVVRQGTALSVWENKVTIAVSETELTDYVDGKGYPHYVAKLAGITADGSVVDWRVKGGLDEHVADGHPHEQYLEKTQKASEQEVVSGVDDDKYITSKKLMSFINQFGFGNYLNDITFSSGSLNDLVKTGLYSINSAKSTELPPSNSTGFNLFVLARASTYITQLAFPINRENRVVYYRHMIAGHWQDNWSTILSEEYLTETLFQKDFSDTGWRIGPDGYIEVWGKLTGLSMSGDSAFNVTFPITFPTKVVNAQWGVIGALSSKNIGCYVTDVSTSGMTLIADKDVSVSYVADAYWSAKGW